MEEEEAEEKLIALSCPSESWDGQTGHSWISACSEVMPEAPPIQSRAQQRFANSPQVTFP